ncbi:helix-turn-helix transcriptional regulator [Paenibacillus brasilensis]|uniref:Transcriptional regulator with XRE-family HTH domain n=1 Tax=Paenibacillus brasilensis TaxID=128574 RepID=A0ABU0L1C9_9BACL|nr:helix-turn-helix transcriptional regulator [Paenibacillus brasilensis]MDQ0495498.1 transcriptional regulator with XRE-family HTH domain [Paenibacillus brasilensis]
MKEINTAKTLIVKRREKGITQDELAAFIGVTKASVSKWETGQSYPDITFLPQLAAYFNISIDELIGYAPQMTEEDIKKLYHRLASDFTEKPFDEVITECSGIIKKYYSCFPLLLQMALLLTNHHMLAAEPEKRTKMLEESVSLCIRVKTESEDVSLTKDAVSLEATCYLMLQKPQEVLDLLGETLRPHSPVDEMVAQAYQMMGNVKKANEVMQISMYQHLLLLASGVPSYLLLNASKVEKTEEILQRTFALADAYDLEELHPNTMVKVYYTAAQVYCMQGNHETALDMLQKYLSICTLDFSLYDLHGDSYFDVIDDWLKEFKLGSKIVRNEETVKASMIQGIVENPAFAVLAELPRYKSIVGTLKFKLEMNENGKHL